MPKEPTLPERQDLVRLLNTCKTKREVAGRLGITYASLLYRIEKYRIWAEGKALPERNMPT